MIKLNQMSKDIKLKDVDYIIEKEAIFEKILPYLYPKISGDWHIALIEPSVDFVRRIYDADMLPDYLNIDIYMEQSQLEVILLENPKLAVIRMTVWQKYQNLIAGLDVLFEDKAVSEIYRRIGPNYQSLENAVNKLIANTEDGIVRIKDVRLYIEDNSRVYTSQVVRAFLTDNDKAWTFFYTFERDLGTRIAFYSIRKYLRRLLNEKNNFLLNNDFDVKLVEQVDAFSIIRMYILFEEAASYKQLVPILMKYQSKEV